MGMLFWNQGTSDTLSQTRDYASQKSEKRITLYLIWEDSLKEWRPSGELDRYCASDTRVLIILYSSRCLRSP